MDRIDQKVCDDLGVNLIKVLIQDIDQYPTIAMCCWLTRQTWRIRVPHLFIGPTNLTRRSRD